MRIYVLCLSENYPVRFTETSVSDDTLDDTNFGTTVVAMESNTDTLEDITDNKQGINEVWRICLKIPDMRKKMTGGDVQFNVTRTIQQSSNRYNADREVRQNRAEKSQKREPVLVRDYRDNNKWKQGVIVHQLGPVTYQVQVGDLVWKRHIDQIREFVPQENKDIPNILENTKSEMDTELIIVPENNNESEPTNITENKTIANANDTIITRRSERVRKAPERLYLWLN
ncbi:unnamed protein product [Mytilus coruscus]|uniref:Integrase zinc-binding domain-containing protein n=1 Tax=Mytilus coruscus TaxID=42192 RepID=A0A6J8C8U7_MYTCO|nr:unnamed protein product [Mytilus coruscus]